jgi:16S rRNA G966 N2-methylase RsmD
MNEEPGLTITMAKRIELWPVDRLRPYERNARTHSVEQVAQIAASIVEFGFTNPILVDSSDGIIAGHGRLSAAQELGLKTVPVVVLDHLSERQRKAYILADNQLALNAGWDTDLLRGELQDLAELDFDLSLIGFSDDELADLLPEIEELPPEDADADAVPEPPVDPVSKPGDVWLLGKHRVMCGDSTAITDVERLLDGAPVDLVYTDPPYGISIVGEKGNVGGEKLAKVGIYEPVAGDDTIDVALEAIQVIKTLSAKVEIIWGGNYYANALDNSSCWIVWDKDNTGNFADAELAWTNQKTAVRIFKHMWNGMIKASEHGQKRVHPTQKPVKLAEWCFEQYGKDCKTVLDLFCGSGSTLIACEISRKAGYMMELSPAYCDVIVKRWQAFTGKRATLESTGEMFPTEHAG